MPSSCSSTAADSTHKCAVKSGECCPKDWSCVVPPDGTEVCLQNAKGAVCPAGYAVKDNVCALSGTAVSTGTGSTATGGESAVTSIIAVTSTSLSTSFSTSGMITTSATTIFVPTKTGVPSVSVSTSFSSSGSVTVGVPVNVTLTSTATDTTTLSVSTSLSVSGRATVPVNVTLSIPPSGSTDTPAPLPTQEGNAASATVARSGGATVVAAVLAALVLA